MKRLSTAVLLSLFMFLNCIVVNADDVSEASRTQRTTFINTLIDHGVNEIAAANLAEKMERGELLDSMKPEYRDQLPDYETYLGNLYIARYTYPDGSIKDVSITAVQYNGSIYGGSYSSGTQWFG